MDGRVDDGEASGSFELDTDGGDVGEISARDADRVDEEIDIVVAQLKRLTRTANLEFALRVGAVIIHHFYHGDAEAWRSRGPKTASFRRLSQHPELPLSAGFLYRCVALFELCDRLNAAARWTHLGASHLRVVLGLPSAIQERLLATANAQRLTVRMLQQEVLREKSVRLGAGGRRAEPLFTKSLKSVRKCLQIHRDVIATAGALSSEELGRSLVLMEETQLWLDHLSTALRQAMASAAKPSHDVAERLG